MTQLEDTLVEAGKLNIGPHSYQLALIPKGELRSAADEELVGLCDLNGQKISLESGMKEGVLLEVFFHEILHALIYRHTSRAIPRDKEEGIVDGLSCGLAELLRTNAALFTSILGCLQRANGKTPSTKAPRRSRR